MPDFDKNLKPILKNPDTQLPQIDNPASSGSSAFKQSVSSLGAGGTSNSNFTEELFGKTKPSAMAPTVSDKELYDNRRYGVYNSDTLDIEDQKAYGQSNLDKATNGILKGLNLTATTIAGGFGMLGGLAISPFTGRLADIWDNEVTNALDEWNNKVDQEYLPNYYTNVEKDAAWYSTDNWIKTNFLFDKLIKNSGFAVGAMLSGNIANGALKAAGSAIGSALEAAEGFKMFTPLLRNTARAFSQGKNIEAAQALERNLSSISDISTRTSELANIAKTTSQIAKFSDKTRRSIIAAYSSAGEASWEALSTQKELRNSLIEEYKKANNGEEPIGDALRGIEEQAQKVGLTSFLGNMALLTVTEYTQLSKLLGSSYSAEKQAANSLLGVAGDVVIKDGKYVSKAAVNAPTTMLGRLSKVGLKAGKYVFDPKEYFQEIGQYALQVGAQNYYNKAFQGKEADAWTDGFLFGLFDEEKGAFQSKEGLESGALGGITGGLMQALSNRNIEKAKQSNTTKFVATLNSAPTAKQAFTDKLNSINRAVTLQQEQQEAIVAGNKLEAKDLETDMMFNYLSSRIKYGRYDMVKEDLSDIRTQLSSPDGLASLKEEGIANINDTVSSFTKRLDILERTADQTNELYKSLNLRYSGLVDGEGKRVYTNDVIEKMAYAAHKIADYDNRLIDLAPTLVKAALNTEDVKTAVAASGDVVEAVKSQEAIIDNLDILPDEKEDIKQAFADYVEIATRRKKMLEEYNQLKETPQNFVQPTQEAEEAATPTTIKITDKDGKEKDYEVGTEYYLGKVVEYDKNGNEVYRFPKITILGENEDGTLKIKSSTGIVKDIDKDVLADYKLGKVSALAANKTANYYFNHINDVYEYNFGKTSEDKKRRGRLQYDPESNKLYFVYKNYKGETKRKELLNEHFTAQEGFKSGRIRIVNTLKAATAEAKAARLAKEQEEKATSVEEALAKNKQERLRIVTELTDDTRKTLDSVQKKILSKKEELEKINNDIKELSIQKAPEASTKKEKARDEKYPELSRKTQKFNKVFSTTSRAITKLSRLKESVEEEIALLQGEQDELEFSLQYFEDFAQNVSELPDKGSDLLKELNNQIDWNKELIKETDNEINTLSSMLKDINKALVELASFLDSAIKKFTADFPQELRSIFDGILASKTVSFSEAQSVGAYATDLALLEDTQKEITVSEKQVEDINNEIESLYKKVEELGKENQAKEAILNKFNEEVEKYREAERQKQALLRNKELQDKFFKYQKDASKDAGILNNDLSEEEIKDENKKLGSAEKPVSLVYNSTIVSSTSARESDVRHDEFVGNIDMLPNSVRTGLRRIYVTKNNEKALGLDGITALHLNGYTPTSKDDELVLAVYVSVGNGDSISFVDKEGKPVGKIGEQADLQKLVWASMPSATIKGTPTEEKQAYLEAYKQVRKKIFSLTDSILPPEEFAVSNGIIKRFSDKREKVVGTLLSEEQMLTKEDAIQIATTGTIVAEGGRSVPVRVGSPYVVNGGSVRILNNRNLTENEVETVYEVLKQFVKKANTDKVFDNEIVKYLHGILFFSSPYQTNQEGETVKGEIGRNQFFFRKGNFYFGKNEVAIPFTEESLEQNKEQVLAFLKGAYNNINNKMLKDNSPYTEYMLKDGKLTTKQWPTYQQYLLSTEGRTNDEIPVWTNIKPVNPSIEGDRLYETGSRYTFSTSLVQVEEQPEEVAPPAPQAPAPMQKAVKSNDIFADMARIAAENKAKKQAAQKPVAAAISDAKLESVPVQPSEGQTFSIDDIFGPSNRKTDSINPEISGESQFRVVGAYNYTIADVEKERAYILQRTPFAVDIVDNLIKAGNGIYAWGSYVDSAIKLYSRMEEGTGYHEMFEGIYDVSLSTSEKDRIYKEFTQRDGTFVNRETGEVLSYKEATIAQAKEQMAEEFRDKVLYNIDPPKAKTSFIANMINKLWKFIKSILSDEIKDLNDLFARMDAGHYKNAPFKSAPTTQEQFRRVIGSLDVKDTDTVIKNVVSRIFQTLFSEGKIDVLNNLDFAEFNSENVYDKIYQALDNYYNVDLKNFYATNGISEADYNKEVLPIWASISGDWTKVKAYSRELLKTFKIIEKEVEDKESENSEYGGRNNESYLQKEFSYDAKKNAPASVKLLIATIQESVFASVQSGAIKISEVGKVKSVSALKDSSTKLEEMVSFAKMFNYTLNELSSVNTLKDKEAKIKQLAETNPNFVRLYNRLKVGSSAHTVEEWALKVKFYNTFAKQRPVALINYIQTDGTTTIGQASTKDAVKILSSNWLGNIQESDLVEQVNGEFIFDTSKVIKGVANKVALMKWLRDFKIEFTSAQQANLSNEDLKKLTKAADRIKSVFKGRKIKANSLKSLEISGPLSDIFEVYIRTQNLAPESTHINISGERVQEFAQTNAASRITNDINNATTLASLFEELPHLNSDFSRDSVYLNKVLFNEAGSKLGTNLSVKYVQGTIDLRDEEATPTDRLTRAARLLQAINQNLNENYYILIPADSKTEYMVGMKNLYSGLEDSIQQFWNYYQTEQSLGTSKGRVFAFLGDGLTEEQFKQKFTDFVNSEVEQQFKELSDYGVITPSGNNYAFNGLDKNFAAREKYNHSRMSEEQIKKVLFYRTVNFSANNIEIHKLFFGDTARYEDPTKRYKSFLSPREQSVYNTPELNSLANETFNTVDGIQLKQGDPGYDLYSDYIKTVTEEDVTVVNEELAKLHSEYANVKSTDGQAIAHLASYKQMRIKNGWRWSSSDEKQFQYEMAKDRLLMEKDGLFSYKGRESLKEHDKKLTETPLAVSTFSPLKPIVSGFNKENPLLDKYSIYAITYNAVRGTNLANQYKRMLDNGVGYKIFESGRKVGVEGKETSYDKEGNPKTTAYNQDAIVKVPYKWFGIQVETLGDKDKQTVGSQVSKLDTINMMSGGLPIDYDGTYEGWISLDEDSKKQFSKIYTLIAKERSLREEMVDIGYSQLLKKVGINSDGTVDSQKFLDVIKDELTRRDLNENLREALSIDPATQEFKIPIEALNNYEQIKSIVFAYVNKYIATPKVNGGPKIQVSGAGWEVNGKRIVAKEVTNKKGEKVTVYTSSGLKFYSKEDPYMEIMLPAWFGKKLRNAGFDVDNKELLDSLLATEEGKEILTGIGFRIPTQEMNSIEAFRIAGFLPESMGDTVIVPEEIVTKAGSDFDVDKLNTYLKNVYINSKGEVKLVPYFGMGQGAISKLGELAAQMVLTKGPRKGERNLNVEDLTEEDLEDDLYDETTLLYKQSIENEYFKTMEQLITLPENFDRLIVPNNSDDLLAMRKMLVEISEAEFGEGNVKSIISPSYMNNLRHNYITGKGGVGIAAVNQTNTAIVQKSLIIVDPERIKKLTDVNEKNYIGDADVKLPSNRVTFNGKKYATLSVAKDVAGKFISDKVSQYINGFVDIGKDAFISQIGVTRQNASTYLLLEKLGVPTKTVVLFMNQPVVREFQKNLAKAGMSYPFNKDIIDETLDMFPSSTTTNQYGKDVNNQLESYIRKFYKDQGKFSNDENAFQHFVLSEYLKYTAMAGNLFRLTQGTNFDTASFSNPYLVERKIIKKRDAQENNVFSSADAILNNTFIGKLGEKLVEATDDIARSFFKFVHPDIQPYIFPIIREIGERKRLNDADFIKVARRVEQSFINYLVQTSTKLNEKLPFLLVNEQTALATEIQSLKAKINPNSTLAKNVIIQMLATEERSEALDTKVVKLFNKSNDVFSQNTYIASMEELKNNPATRELYGKLLRVAFLQSGIATSPISFTEVIPVEDYKEFIMPAIRSLSNTELLRNFIQSDAFYRNNWKNPDIVPIYKDKIVDTDQGEVNKRLFRSTSLSTYAAKKGINNLVAYKVSTLSAAYQSKFIVVYQGKGKDRMAKVLRRVDYANGIPYTQPYSLKYPDNKHAVYVAVNAWGDGYKAQEYYTTPRQSVLNNKTMRVEAELANEEIIAAIKGEAPQLPDQPFPDTTLDVKNEKCK